jgi:Ni/Fe-hydrogenase subunit HybB-like protein
MQNVEDARRLEPVAPVVAPGHTPATVTDKISYLVLERRTSPGWYLGFAISFVLLMLLLFTIAHLLVVGVGIWGINIPVAWGFDIVNFVWWTGVSHAGTLIAAVLLLTRQEWRGSVSRFAEAMTLFALSAAVLFPLLHMGRPWLFYYLAPYPNTMALWPAFTSPLVWDFFAIFAYALVAVMFWYTGLLPDLATLRDRARNKYARFIYGTLAMGWRGSGRHWQRYQQAYLILAVLTPFIVTVHSVVGLAFATTIVPGWHSTLLPPNFIAGAIFSGFGMVLALTVPLRAIFGLHDLITTRHLDNLAKILLGSGLLVAYAYLMDGFTVWYSRDQYQMFVWETRFTGSYAPLTWILVLVNIALPQALWFRSVRRSPLALFSIGFLVTIGMWLDRFLVVVTGQSTDYLPSAWHLYQPILGDWALFIGSIGLFFTILFLYVRFLPVMSMYEMQELVSEKNVEQPRRRLTGRDARKV